MAKTIKLQGIGEHKAIEVCEVRPNMCIVWSYGNCSIVDSIEPSKTGKTYTLTLVSCQDQQTRTRRMNAHTLVAIDDEVFVNIIGRRDGIHDMLCNTDDDNWQNLYDSYCDIAEEAGYVKVFAERSDNGGHTWEVVAEYVPTNKAEAYMVAADAVKVESMSVPAPQPTTKEYVVSFRRDEDGVNCANIAIAQCVEDVEAEYADCDWVSVTEASKYPVSIDSLKKRGYPIVTCEHIDETDEDTDEQPTMKAQNITIDISRLGSDDLRMLASITYRLGDMDATKTINDRAAFQNGWMSDKEEAEYFATYC